MSANLQFTELSAQELLKHTDDLPRHRAFTKIVSHPKHPYPATVADIARELCITRANIYAVNGDQQAL